jgi:AcrR family transcriptional regulator
MGVSMGVDGRARRADPRAKLSHEQVLRAAWAMLDEAGLESFSIRRLAQRLGVAPMTVYGYFRDRDALLDAVLDYGADGLIVAAAEGDWRTRMSGLMSQLHRQLVAHPFVVELRLRRPILNPGSMRFTEAGLTVLGEAGFAPEQGARAFRALFIYTFGSAAFGMPPDAAHAQRETRSRLAALDETEFPAVARSVPALIDTIAGEEQFHRGLGWLLDALAAEAGAGKEKEPR